MISSSFYNKKRLCTLYASAPHFPHKQSAVILKHSKHILRQGETVYTLAEKYFGEGNDAMWTFIADANPTRHPSYWKEGDVIRIPMLIVKETNIYAK